MKNLIRNIFSRFIFYTGMFHLSRFLKKDEITILNYHNINSEDFESHIKGLLNYYRVISIEDCIDSLKGNTGIDYGIVITFDDGYESFYSDIFPLLKKYNIPATVFLSTDYVGTSKLFWFDLLEIIAEEKPEAIFEKLPKLNGASYDYIAEYFKQFDEDERKKIITEISGNNEDEISKSEKAKKYKILNWSQIKEMHELGLVTFGAHTLSHPILSRIPDSKAQKEISESKEIIEKNLGTIVKHFAYPNGDASDFNDSIIDILKESGFECALTTINGNCTERDNLFTLKRKAVDSKFNKFSLLAKISGLWISLTKRGI